MPRKAKKFIPPFLSVSVHAEGKMLFNLLIQDAVMPTAQHMQARVQVDDTVDHDRLCATMIESAATLYRDRSHEREILQAVAAWFGTRGTPMADHLDYDEIPF